MPEQTPLTPNQVYYVPCVSAESDVINFHWSDHKLDKFLLEKNLIHLKPENAKLHGEAMCKFTVEYDETNTP